jgi:peptidoglycan/LPS O-acetylase OafA/YrhL
MVGLVALFAMCVAGWMRQLASGPLPWLGAISYPLYLTHQMIGYRVMQSILGAGWSAPAAVGATVIFALLLASAISVTIERPVMRAIRSWYRRAERTALDKVLETHPSPAEKIDADRG